VLVIAFIVVVEVLARTDPHTINEIKESDDDINLWRRFCINTPNAG